MNDDIKHFSPSDNAPIEMSASGYGPPGYAGGASGPSSVPMSSPTWNNAAGSMTGDAQREQAGGGAIASPARVRSKLTPQVIMLLAVGAGCLAIFVIGAVLFVTTEL